MEWWVLPVVTMIGLIILFIVVLWALDKRPDAKVSRGEPVVCKVAIPPKGTHWNSPYLIDEKEYTIISEKERSFAIKNEIGTVSYCLRTKCPHLSGKDWIIKEKVIYK